MTHLTHPAHPVQRTRGCAADRHAPPEVDRLEVVRLAALHGYDLLDTPADPALDAVVRLAAAIAGVTTATINLIDAHRQCQLSAVGFAGGPSERSESLCARNLGHPEVVHVPDARRDPRYRDSAWVDGRFADVVFYASLPLVTAEGHHLGSLCVFDAVRRELTPDQLARLRDLADVVMALLDGHRRHREQQRLVAEVEEQRELAELTLTELEAREEFTRALLTSVDVGVLACDAAGRLTVVNPTARRLHGRDADLGLPASEFALVHGLHAADGRTPLAPEEAPLRRALVEGHVRDVEVVIAPAGRTPVRVLCTGRALHDHAGRVIGAVVAVQDITTDRARIHALEAAGEQLRRQGRDLACAVTELRRSNDELGDLAAVASHDLAAPLTSVLGYLELVLDVHGDALGGEGREWLATAMRAAQRMQGLIEAVLDHARADSTGLDVRPVIVSDVLTHVVEDLGATAVQAEIVLTGTSRTAHADPVLLRQLLQNLVGNSVRYRSPERPCRVEVRVRDLAGGGWELAVADNGRGIPPGQREQVFAMFAVAVTGENTGENIGAAAGARRPGHGIGLATCRRIVARHGGRISAEETPGGGATLRAVFPSVQAPRWGESGVAVALT
ncbi:ATP-binding protein [Kineococcus sp. R86509]|uniref:sensor histidine kinase n=1 Tax=Kineococcus sp. R86509 TaxID=3093851 RepID=UPI0036D2D113